MKYILSLLLCSLSFFSQANRFWVFFNPNSELKNNIALLKQNDYTPINTSTWLNAVTINDTNQLSLIRHLEIDSIRPVNSFKIAKNNNPTLELHTALIQLKSSFFTERGLDGKGIKIGITDAGFVRIDSNKAFKHLFENNQIKAYKDFVSPDRKDFFEKEHRGDTHGRSVLNCIAGRDDKKQSGFATAADFYLARTENAKIEDRIEEDNWIAAIEWLDSLGVRLVNTSLGYSHLFDDVKNNYTPEEMNGNTAVISKAAKIATEEKGMFLVVSAGNEGKSDYWKIISAPADVETVFSIGATNYPIQHKMGYSSKGTEFTPFLKPDVSCFSKSGTSFSAPIITGMVACIMQLDSTLSNNEIKTIIKQSSSLHAFPNNYLGHGVPDCEKILAIADSGYIEPKTNTIQATNNFVKIRLPKKVGHAILFHKKDDTHVLAQSVITKKRKKKKKLDKSSLKIKKKKTELKIVQILGVYKTTVNFDNTLTEILWKE